MKFSIILFTSINLPLFCFTTIVDNYTNDHSETITLICENNIPIKLDHLFCNKFKYFKNPTNSGNLIKTIKINFDVIYIIKLNILSNIQISSPISENNFLEFISLMSFLQPKENFSKEIYLNFINSYLKYNMNKEMPCFQENKDPYKLKLYKNIDPLFWYLFFKIKMKNSFSLEVIAKNTNLTISDLPNEKNPEIENYFIYELTEIRIKSNSFDKIIKSDDEEYFVRVFQYFIYELIENNNIKNNIYKLEIEGTFDLLSLNCLNLIFKENTPRITHISFKNFGIFPNYINADFAYIFEKFFGKFPYLEIISLKPSGNHLDFLLINLLRCSYIETYLKEIYLNQACYLSEISKTYLLGIKNLKTIILESNYTLYSPEMLKNSSLQITVKRLSFKGYSGNSNFIHKFIENFRSIESLSISRCDIKSKVWKKISNIKNLQGSLKKLYLSNLTEIHIYDKFIIKNFRSLVVLYLKGLNFNYQVLENILGSKKFQKSLVELNISNNAHISKLCTSYIMNFDRLSTLSFCYPIISIADLLNILSSTKIQQNMINLKLTGNKNIFFCYDELKKFEKLKTLDLSYCDLNQHSFDYILNFKNLHLTIESLILKGNEKIQLNHLNLLFQFKKLKYLDILYCKFELEILDKFFRDNNKYFNIENIFIS
ncbi:hypothetical protein DMUE_3770 [Dictyocoela muelleri]|nr:hypothetical protein DMUE_3770 [Dictyocoela muelleri]